MKKALAAFTVIELTIAIVVIGILATIAVAGYNSLQQDSRNGQRVSDVQLLTTALEKYFNQNGEYPPCNDLQQSPEVVSTDVLEGLDKVALVAPLAADQSASSIVCRDIESTDGDVYAFIGDTSIDCVNNIACASWTVRYKEEGSNTIKEYKSRNQDALAGPPVTPVTDPDEPPATDIAACQVGAPIPAGFTLYDATGQTTVSLSAVGNRVVKNLDVATLVQISAPSNIIVCGGDATQDMTVTSTGAGTKTIITGSGEDSIESSSDGVFIYSSSGDDSIVSHGGTARIYAGTGDDTVSSNGGTATIYGADGADIITSNGGSATIYGGKDNDTIVSNGPGATIYGGPGIDSITANGPSTTVHQD